jgi:hypothetical protein
MKDSKKGIKTTHLSSEVLEDSGEVNGSSSTNTFGVVALAKHSMDTSDGELKSGTARAGLSLDTLMKYEQNVRLTTNIIISGTLYNQLRRI